MAGSAATPSTVQASSRAEDGSRAARAFGHLAWISLGYTVLVILFGAWVRISGSGAGCGQHWPTCQGEVIPRAHSVQMAIELTHRVTSGASLLLVVALLVWAFRSFPRGHLARRASVFAMAFMLGEALVGAALVLLKLVGHNDSVARALVMGVHLANTFLLTGALAIAARSAHHPAPLGFRPRGFNWWLVAALAGTLLLAMLGAITALGDTLHPLVESQGVAARLAADHSVTAGFLQRAREVHPVGAVLLAALLFYLVSALPQRHAGEEVRRGAIAVGTLVLVQIATGVVNIVLSAPGWMQVVHLALATLLWIALVLLSTAALAASPGSRVGSPAWTPPS